MLGVVNEGHRHGEGGGWVAVEVFRKRDKGKEMDKGRFHRFKKKGARKSCGGEVIKGES